MTGSDPRTRHLLCVAAVLCLLALPGRGAAQSDERLVLQFQRAADSYAFAHRQAERQGLRPAIKNEGEFFSAQVAAVLRQRLISGARRAGCSMEPIVESSWVPRVNQSTDGTQPLADCFVRLLPPLPPELEYRRAGVALVLADAHLHVVIDVLHAAFPVP